MEHRAYRQPGEVVIELSGDVGADDWQVLQDVIEEAMDGHEGRVVLEVSALKYLTSAAIGVLASAQRKLAEKGDRLVVRHPSKVLSRLLRVTRLNTVLEVQPASDDERGAER